MFAPGTGPPSGPSLIGPYAASNRAIFSPRARQMRLACPGLTITLLNSFPCVPFGKMYTKFSVNSSAWCWIITRLLYNPCISFSSALICTCPCCTCFSSMCVSLQFFSPTSCPTPPPLSADPAETSAWRRTLTLPSLPESHRSVPVAHNAHWFRKILAFAGPGYLVAVGYMDPGNWATDIGGGSKFGYTLLSVILISNLMAMFLQALSAKLGIATGLDLAQACREQYSRRTGLFLWVVCEIAIAACDLAEVLGSAVALKLLFGLPLLAGVLITPFDLPIFLPLPGPRFPLPQAFVVTLIASIAACF